MIATDDLNRLTWQCRRGMLELDIFLNRFFKEAYLNLNQQDKEGFVKLLTSTDQDLFVWLTGREEAPDPELAKIVKLVRHHANPLL